jgi:hypothetical protein
MTADSTDICIVGLDEEHTTRADPSQPLYDVHFTLSAEAPVGWGQIVQTHIGSRGVAGRKAWPQRRYIVVRCTIDEIEQVLAALRPVLEVANREYRVWSAARDCALLAEEAFDRQELQKLRDLKARLGFD